MEVQLCPVVRVHALAVLLFDAAGPLGPPLLVQQAANRSQGAHGDEDHRCDHTWGTQQGGRRVTEENGPNPFDL